MSQTEAKIREQKTKVKGRRYMRYVVDYGVNGDGKRVRRTFSTRGEAEADIKEQSKLQKRIGRAARKLRDADLMDAAQALDVLQGQATLTAAAAYYFNHHEPNGGQAVTVDEVRDELIQEGIDDGLRDASQQDDRQRLARFLEDFSGRLISEIKPREVQGWLRGLRKRNGEAYATQSKRHYKTVIGKMFNFAIDQGYVEANPFQKKSRRRRKVEGREDETMPEILTVKQVEDMLIAATEYAMPTVSCSVSSMVPALAIGFLAGVRTRELMRLDWKDIDVTERRITIQPSVAKKRSVRHIDMQDNLAAWLAPYNRECGQVAPESKGMWRFHFDKVKDEARIYDWPINAMRHCFGSFHLAHFENENLTALQMGHRSTDILFNHYRGLVKRQDAAHYWSILPKQASSVIKFPKTA